MNIEINQKNIENFIDKSYLTEIIAEKIVKSKTNQTWDEFNDELKNALQIAVKEIVNDYVKNYYSGQGIESQVADLLKKMTKEDILKIISNKI